jgi:signal transduction histidine kinase
VNNFSEVSVEIVQELREDLAAIREKLDEPSFKRLEASCLDLGENARKIHEHGKRADGIVKGMLEHSRGQTGEREMVNINALVDEYVTLAYHGVKGQQPEVMISFKKEYDNTIGSIEAFPGDLSRVILNVVNNACYAVNEKQKAKGAIFSPTIWVSTENQGNNVVIRIRDNGTGMPKDVADKIFNPFFTTKPTGKGTGLGLSLSHDIIAKQHGGTIEVDTVLGEFSEFRIILPKPR